jgi:tetratricopeptide (TPR) repeat protein
MSQFDFEGAEREQRIAEELSPGSEYVLHNSAQYFAFVGWPAEKAIDYAQRLRRLDPLNPWVVMQEAIAYFHSHQYQKALRVIDDIMELDPHFWIGPWARSLFLDALGRHDEAVQAALRAVELNDYAETQAFLAIAYARVGRQAEARSILERLSRPAKGKYWPPTQKAAILAALGDRDGALTALETAYAEKDWWLPQALHWLWLVSLHGEPRFERLVRLTGQEKRVREARIAWRMPVQPASPT